MKGVIDEKGNIYAIAEDQKPSVNYKKPYFLKVNIFSEKLEYFSEIKEKIDTMNLEMMVNDKNIYCKTPDGIYVYDKKGKLINKMTYDYNKKNSLRGLLKENFNNIFSPIVSEPHTCSVLLNFTSYVIFSGNF
ncbi:hypothetical protein JCM30566_17500 [Marinitoga arctica]